MNGGTGEDAVRLVGVERQSARALVRSPLPLGKEVIALDPTRKQRGVICHHAPVSLY